VEEEERWGRLRTVVGMLAALQRQVAQNPIPRNPLTLKP
jgi:hypothetical protein